MVQRICFCHDEVHYKLRLKCIIFANLECSENEEFGNRLSCYGIGQSRLCMLLMGKAHIGEVQSSIWDEETHRVFDEAGITLL